MKTFLILCMLSFVVLAYPRGCLYTIGRCVSECEEGTHRYNTGCDYLKPEPTCTNPTPVTDTSVKICDFSACYCDPPTVRNKVTDECVCLEECPK